MRTRLFLRTAEFLWQEGHTAHETRDEAWDETIKMLDVYREFAEEYMAMPVICGEKTEGERFPGADNTFCIEAMMQDRKALQAGTSHFLGQNFAKAAEIQYQSREGKQEYAWTTSWGVSTRLIGGMIMTHADDNGMVLPPRLAPSHVIILPILRKSEDAEVVLPYCESLCAELKQQAYDGKPVRVELDKRDLNAGEKSWQWIKRGAPVIVEVGPRDIQNNAVFVGRRDKTRKERYGQDRAEFIESIATVLEDMQKQLFDRAKAYRDENLTAIDNWKDFQAFFTPENTEKPEIHGGFVRSHWCGGSDCENRVNDDLSVTIRCIPFNQSGNSGKCIVCGRESDKEVIFAKAY